MNNPYNTTGLEIAVIGMAVRFPGAKNYREYWENLLKGEESISFFSDEELQETGIPLDLINNPNYVKANGYLKNHDMFDSSFFCYSPSDAEILDPQIRIAHETVYEALEDSGINPYQYKGSIGLILGCASSIEWQSAANNYDQNNLINLLNKSKFFATRISHKLNLKGPSYGVQTACSSSLVAVHQACQSIILGESDICLAGGVSVNMLRKEGYLFQEGMIKSADGHCKPFDNVGDGIVAGDGVGIVVLKTLEDAIKDNDHIYAVIKGSGINNDGNRRIDYTAPSVKGQADLIRSVHYLAETPSETITYVETHGTGTKLGDPIEIEALKLAFDTEKKNFCAIGSVKGNVGHLDNASGIAGFIKTVLSLYHQKIPASINCNKTNENIDFEGSPFFLNTKLKEWLTDNGPLRAGVSSLGIGGTNAHVVLEEAKLIHEISPKLECNVIILSAKSKEALKRSKQNLLEYLRCNQDVNISDVAYTLQVGRAGFNFRDIIVCSEIDDAIESLAKSVEKSSFSTSESINPVFMFPGQGCQYVNMAKELYDKNKYFREQFGACITFIKKTKGIDLLKFIFPDSENDVPETEINQACIAQPLIFSVDYSIAKFLIQLGIKPKAMIGHSLGEYVAACIAGVFSLEDALSLVFERGQLMRKCPKGEMLSIMLPEKKIIELIKNTKLSIAAANAIDLNVVSGNFDEIKSLKTKLDKLKARYVQLPASHANHSEMMEPVMDEFAALFKNISLNKPNIPFVSNLDGKWIDEEKVITAEYWVTHLRHTVRFFDGMDTLLMQEKLLCIEVGPGNTLCTFLRQHSRYNEARPKVLNTIRQIQEKTSDIQYLFKSIGKTWCYGVDILWESMYSQENKQNRLSLPTYPFEQIKYSRVLAGVNNEVSSLNKTQQNEKKQAIDDWFYVPSWKRSELPRQESCTTLSFSYMVFIDQIGIANEIISELEKQGHRAITVETGKKYNQISDFRYEIRARKKEDYKTLFDNLREQRQLPNKILHLWGVSNPLNEKDELGYDKVELAQELGYYSLINLVQTYNCLNTNLSIDMYVITNNMQDVIGNDLLNPEKSTVLGPIKVIPREYPNIKCKSIDIEINGTKSNLSKYILLEINDNNNEEDIVAYRNNYRWLPSFEKEKFIKKQGVSDKLKKEGVYLITGGMGGIGLVLAEYLAEELKAKLVLCGRSEFPEKAEWDKWIQEHSLEDSVSCKIEKIKQIELKGGEILICKGDVANEAEMQEVVEKGERFFGKINGVIHAAGTADGRMIALRDTAQSESVFASKIRGTLVLNNIFKDKELDFLIYCSSLNSIIPAIGLVGYCAANIFLDRVSKIYCSKKDYFVTSINWDTWQSVGMAVKSAKELEKILIWNLSAAILPEEGRDVFNRILNSQIPQVIVSTVPLKTRMKSPLDYSVLNKIFNDNATEDSVLKTRPELTTEYAYPENDIEKRILKIWQKIFRYASIGIDDDFYELGGHSLIAMSLSSILTKELEVDVSIQEILGNTTIRGMANNYYLKTKNTVNQSNKKSNNKIYPFDKEYYLLSSAQKRLLIINKLDSNNAGYNLSKVFYLDGKVDKDKLENSFKQLIERHCILRTSFGIVNNEPVQKILNNVDFKITEKELIDRNIDDEIKEFIKAFDLQKPPHIRVSLIKVGVEKHYLMIDLDHIVSDGVSVAILIDEFKEIYSGKELSRIQLHYKDYAEYQNSNEFKDILQLQEKYWMERLSNKLTTNYLPTDYNRPVIQSIQGDSIYFAIDNKTTQQIKSISRKYETTYYVYLLSVLNILMEKYTNLEDILIASPVSGRSNPDVQKMIGMFVNMLIMRNFPNKNLAFKDFLNEVKKNSIEAFKNQDYPFEELIRKIEIYGNMGRNPLLHVVFAMQNMENKEFELEGIKITPYNYEYKNAQFDLLFVAIEMGDEISIKIEYSTELFSEPTIVKMKERFLEILRQVVEIENIKMGDIEISHQLKELSSVVAGNEDFLF